MLRDTFRRFLIGLVQLLGLVIAVFFLIRLLPADPVSRLVGMNASKPMPRPNWGWTGPF